MPVKEYSCPGDPRHRPVSLTNAILTCCCPTCGWGVASVSDNVYGLEQLVASLKADLYQQLGDVAPPGKATITSCDECGGRGCQVCHGTASRSGRPARSAATWASTSSTVGTMRLGWCASSAAGSSGRLMIRGGRRSVGPQTFLPLDCSNRRRCWRIAGSRPASEWAPARED